ncbi:MAG: uroporphyrinogen decarboxylase [Verrucomicrobia bacterium]|nr:uroporphyrinogen decarboxylase [Verrucomicrobiota bacterium]
MTNDLFLRACSGESISRPPVWMMRQAGRYMAEYRALRAQHSILEMIKDPELAAEVTLQPIKAFPLDAAIIFADILTLLEPMGLQLEFISGKGPVFHNPIRDAADVAALKPIDPRRDLGFTLDAIQLTRERLAGQVPLIGFSGAPYTLACYAIEGGGSKDFDQVRAWMYAHPKIWTDLMDKLTEGVTDYLLAQIASGAQAVHLFDSWAVSMSQADYRRQVAPWTRRIFETLAREAPDVPRIHFSANGGHLLEAIAEMPVDVLGLDWRVDAKAAIQKLGTHRVYQGNLDPARMLASDEAVIEGAREVKQAFSGAKAHIFNLGHGIIKTTPTDRVRLLIEEVRKA